MKRCILYFLIAFICYSCYDEIDMATCITGNEELNVLNSREDTLLGKFVCRSGGFSNSKMRELNQGEKNTFNIWGRFVFNNGGVLTYLLYRDVDAFIGIAVDKRLGKTGEMENKDAYYEPNLSTIFFKERGVTEIAIQHEFLHYVQHHVFNYTMSGNYKRSIEFEAYMAMDIINAIEKKAFPGTLHVSLREGMEEYRNMIASFAEGSFWSLESILQKFNVWIKDWQSDEREGSIHPQSLINWLYRVATRQIDITMNN
ncbi:hypothetical protein [uncultured Butyricimonas sp.]|uniref:hypothetical protein n=1 Tax=uncultured Butyricimonas sp. TaxID=1268785 RepID=UPI0026DBF047|nr:hypothetical protein [uncultured Butyricimonas sp.]